MHTLLSHFVLGLGFVFFLRVGDSCAWGQTVEEVNYSGWGDTPILRCGGCCLPIHRRTVKLSFYPIASLEHRKPPSSLISSRVHAFRHEEKCQCINEALSLYGLIWSGLQRKEITPDQAKAQLTVHLDCETYCGRWEDCENLLRFIDRELALLRMSAQ